MNEPLRCPQCGAALPAGSPDGLCPACLLRRGLEGQTAGFTEMPASRWEPPAVEELAGNFPELEIMRLIGRGGMGAVYQARQKNLDRMVALKILPPEMGNDAAFAERFAREAQAMARLNHPHVVAIYEFGDKAGLYFFVMEYVDGTSLRTLLDSGHVTPREALAIVPQICEALQYAHDQGIVHRDIKPENILLNKQGQVKIADFGLAKLMGRSGEAEKVMGTPAYMAPEQIERPAEVDRRADIYSLGVVFYQMLTGELPVGKFVVPSKKVQIDVRLDQVVLKALEREPEKRYQQASEVKTEVETLSQTPAAASRFAVAPPPSAAGKADPLDAATALERARRDLQPPSIGLRIAANINLLLILVPLVAALLPRILSFMSPPVNGENRTTNTLTGIVLLPTVVYLLLNLALLVRANGMAKLRNYTSAVVASILGMLLPPGNLIGLPMGIWALVLLNRPDMKAAFGAAARRPANSGNSRVSGPASGMSAMGTLAGTLLLHGLALAGAWLFFVTVVPRYVVLFARSAVSLPTATVAVIHVTSLLQSRYVWVTVFLLALLFLAADGVLCWQLQRSGLRRLQLAWSMLVVVGLGAVVLLAAGTMQFPNTSVISGAPRASGDLATPTFGPVIETVILYTQAPDFIWTDLDTGKGFSAANLPKNADINDDGEGLKWRLRTGAEAGAEMRPTNAGILALDTRAAMVANFYWDSSASEIQRLLNTLPEAPTTASKRAQSTFLTAPEFPATFVFQTRQGAGILQILEESDSAKGVRVRIRPLIAARDSHSSTQPADTEAALMGRWESTKIENAPDIKHAVLTFSPDHKVAGVTELADGTGEESSSEWSVAEGSYLRIKDPNAVPELYRFELNGDTLVIHEDAEGKITLRRTPAPEMPTSPHGVGPAAVPATQGSAAVPSVRVARAEKGDIGVYLDAVGSVAISDASTRPKAGAPATVEFTIPQASVPAVVKKFDAGEKLNVSVLSTDFKPLAAGTLVGIDNKIDTATGMLKCKASVAGGPDTLLYPGQLINVRLLLETKHDVTMVPVAAIDGWRGGPRAYVVGPDGAVSERKVTRGIADNGMVEVTAGLSPGELVVMSPQNELHAGEVVQYSPVAPAATRPAAATESRAAALGSQTADTEAALLGRWEITKVQSKDPARVPQHGVMELSRDIQSQNYGYDSIEEYENKPPVEKVGDWELVEGTYLRLMRPPGPDHPVRETRLVRFELDGNTLIIHDSEGDAVINYRRMISAPSALPASESRPVSPPYLTPEQRAATEALLKAAQEAYQGLVSTEDIRPRTSEFLVSAQGLPPQQPPRPLGWTDPDSV